MIAGRTIASVVIMAAMNSFVFGAETAMRALEPWWQTSSLEAVARRRREKINPVQWSEQEQAARTFELASEQQEGVACVRILDLFSQAALYHKTDPQHFRGGLYLVYEVLNPLPVRAHLSGGSAYWSYVNYSCCQSAPLYTKEQIVLEKTGVYETALNISAWGNSNGQGLEKGVNRLGSPYGFQILNAASGKWEGCITRYGRVSGKRSGRILKTPKLKNLPQVMHDTMFTAANLTNYELSIPEIVSDWRKGGYVGVKVQVKDADGCVYDVPGAEVTAVVSGKAAHESNRIDLNLTNSFSCKGVEWGFVGALPDDFYEPGLIVVDARIRVIGPDGILRTEELQKTIKQADSKALARSEWLSAPPRQDKRRADGTLLESRFMSAANMSWWWRSEEDARWLIDGMKRARLNIVAPDILVNGQAEVPNTIWPISYHLTKAFANKPGFKGTLDTLPFDGLAFFLKEAHAEGIQVLPWLPLTQMSITKGQHEDLLVVGPEGKCERQRQPFDIHKKAYRDLIVQFAVEVLKRYPDLDGFSLDCVRTLEPCFCDYCKEEYHKTTGRDLLADHKGSVPYPEAYAAWHEQAVSAGVRELREAIDKIKPGLKIMAFIVRAKNMRLYSNQGANAWDWVNKGWVDSLAGMFYLNDPEATMMQWLSIAQGLDNPDKLWVTVNDNKGNLKSLPPDMNKDHLLMSHCLGEDGDICADVDVNITDLKACRDKLHVVGMGIFDAVHAADEYFDGLGRDFFTEKAAPLW